MMTVSRITVKENGLKKLKYVLKEGKDEIARFDDLVTAGLCLRFLKGSMIMKPDYEIAKDALTMWDVANLPDPDDTI